MSCRRHGGSTIGRRRTCRRPLDEKTAVAIAWFSMDSMRCMYLRKETNISGSITMRIDHEVMA
ncbi:hypothetical protein ACHAXA_004484 [Cyclostephanos tholiformis]|uniref:Uncharacterized protein n=1 Tax=Cyclostephanos tholiformis TaxID=382380 RepID=A0ABD3RYP1_9STRA